MTAVENLIFGPAIALNGIYAGDLSAATLNDTNNAEALIIQVPKDGSITKIGLNVFNITGNPPAYNFALTTVDSGTGYPTQTAYGGSSIESEDFTTTGWKWVDLTTPATATKGNFVAYQ